MQPWALNFIVFWQYMYIYIYACICISIYVHIYVYINILCPFVTICPKFYFFWKYMYIYMYMYMYIFIYVLCIYYIYCKKCTVWTGRDDCRKNFSGISKSGTIKWRHRYIMLEFLHNVPLTSLYSTAREKNAGDCEKQPDSITYKIYGKRT